LSIKIPRTRVVAVWDPVSIFLAVIALLIFTWTTTFVDLAPEVAYKALVAVVLLVSGIVLGKMFSETRVDYAVAGKEFSMILAWTAACAAAIVFANIAVPMAVEPLDPRMFAVLIAVSEEVFFRYFATSMFASLTGKWAGTVLSATLFATYHLAVYGGSPSSLLTVWVGGLILSFAFLETKRITPPILAHVLINYIAVT